MTKSPLTRDTQHVQASAVVLVTLLAFGCGRRGLAVKTAFDSGTSTDHPAAAGTDAIALADAAKVIDEAQASTCQFMDTKDAPNANLVGDPSGCPVSLADLPSRCGQVPAQLVRCRDYVQVYFPPDPPEGDLRGKSTCYYTPDGATLIGGWVVFNVYAEDAFPMTAGRIPQGCEATCGAIEYPCPGPQVIDGSPMDSLDWGTS